MKEERTREFGDVKVVFRSVEAAESFDNWLRGETVIEIDGTEYRFKNSENFDARKFFGIP